MLLKQMKYFVAVVDCNSFTEAAEACFISQSAVSQQIQALEKELGVKLLHREHRRFFLTPAGEYFYRQSRLILQETERILRETVRTGRANWATGAICRWRRQGRFRRLRLPSGGFPCIGMGSLCGGIFAHSG